MSTMPDTYNEAEAWAKARIGERVYRPDMGSTCSICRKIVAEGLLINDELQAIYATDCAMEMGYRYQDEPIQPSTGILQQMSDAGPAKPTAYGAVMDTIMEAMLEMNTREDSLRYLWYGPVGWLMFSGDQTHTTDDINATPVQWRELTPDERSALEQGRQAIRAAEISNLEHEKRPPILPAPALPEAQGQAGLRQDPADTH